MSAVSVIVLSFVRIHTDFVYNAQMPAGVYPSHLAGSLHKL